MKKDNKASRRLIAERLDIKEDTVKEYINKLKKKGILKRIRKTNRGYWEVIK